jgi:hypothetical protein
VLCRECLVVVYPYISVRSLVRHIELCTSLFCHLRLTLVLVPTFLLEPFCDLVR